MDFARTCMLNAVSLDTYKPLDLERVESEAKQGYAVLDESFSVYCTICSIYSLDEWGAEICEQDDLTILAFNLLDPSKPHFEDLNEVANIFDTWDGVFSIWRDMTPFWILPSLTDPDLLPKARTFFNLLCADETCKLGQRFLENHGIKNVMQGQLHLKAYIDSMLSDYDDDGDYEDGFGFFRRSFMKFSQKLFPRTFDSTA
jgi:hypothetical protein